MSQSLVQIYVHLVFATFERTPYLKDQVLRERLHAYLAGICEGQDSPALKVGGVEDHVHLLLRLGKQREIAILLRELKRESSKWIKDQSGRLQKFHWQGGYGAFSISPSHVTGLTRYIENQVEHHKRESFQDEFRRLCKKYGVELDERFAWE